MNLLKWKQADLSISLQIWTWNTSSWLVCHGRSSFSLEGGRCVSMCVHVWGRDVLLQNNWEWWFYIRPWHSERMCSIWWKDAAHMLCSEAKITFSLFSLIIRFGKMCFPSSGAFRFNFYYSFHNYIFIKSSNRSWIIPLSLYSQYLR